jgi:hypothetical protein
LIDILDPGQRPSLGRLSATTTEKKPALERHANRNPARANTDGPTVAPAAGSNVIHFAECVARKRRKS